MTEPIMTESGEGYLALLLHAHLPFVRHPEHDRFLEERWFFEAMTESYIPLLIVLEKMVRDGVDFRISWSCSPTLLSMLEDELLRDRYQRHLEQSIELAEKETWRQRHQPHFRDTARFYLERFRLLESFYVHVYQRDLIRPLRELQDKSYVEVLTSAATHGFLPLLSSEKTSVRAQVAIGVDEYRRHFGRDPRGIWLPECGFYPGLDEILAEVGLRYFCVESHGILNGTVRARCGVHAPIVCPSGVAAFGRDPDCTRQVWSTDDGFPGDPDYRDYYRDIGFDLPLDYIGPYVGPDGVRVRTGIKYHRVTGSTDAKEPYVRKSALNKADQHARQFAEWRQAQAQWLGSRLDRPPLILAPYDAELFGHWWYEGPEWIHFLLRRLAAPESTVVTVTPSEYLQEYPSAQVSQPSASSWGLQGYNEVWLSDQNDWLYPRLHRASSEMARLAARFRGAQGLRRRALNQAARELLLAQASDWSFILKVGTSTGYAESRVNEHLDRFHEIAKSVAGESIDEQVVDMLEERDNIFPHLEFELFDSVGEDAASPREPRHVVFLVAEMAPFVKVGGLGDVAGALPAALAAHGVKMTVFLPAYRSIDRQRHGMRLLRSGLSVTLGDETVEFRLLEPTEAPPGVRLLLIENEEFFGRDGVYVDPLSKEEYTDNDRRFAFFTRAALESLRTLGERVDILHCHDHQTALAPAHLKIHYRDDPVLGNAATIYTLHNLGYQGIHGAALLDFAGFGKEQCYPGSYFEYFGKVNLMKVGICFADKVTTVSETYAREICEDKIQSAGLAPVIQTRREDLAGIVNGIDVNEWDPRTDPCLPANYDVDQIDGKTECKRALLEKAGFDPKSLAEPVVGMVSRLVDQKGLDIIEEAFESIIERRVRFVVLGTGVPKYEKFFSDAARRHPDLVAAFIEFDNATAHLMEAGLDIFLMPSLYEPCGLNQMYSLRYGTVPLVRATGGLADTVPDVDAQEEGVGFVFEEYTAEALLAALDRALEAYRDPDRWRSIQRAGMRRDFSWTRSAERYLELYREALAGKARG